MGDFLFGDECLLKRVCEFFIGKSFFTVSGDVREVIIADSIEIVWKIEFLIFVRVLDKFVGVLDGAPLKT
jgi:hypothetical protein